MGNPRHEYVIFEIFISLWRPSGNGPPEYQSGYLISSILASLSLNPNFQVTIVELQANMVDHTLVRAVVSCDNHHV